MQLDFLFEGDEWRDYKNCGPDDTHLFFSKIEDEIRQARKICQKCQVQQQCLDFAIQTNQAEGIWGGLDHNERKKIRRSKK